MTENKAPEKPSEKPAPKEPNYIRKRGGWTKGKPRGKPAWNSKAAAEQRQSFNEKPGTRWQGGPNAPAWKRKFGDPSRWDPAGARTGSEDRLRIADDVLAKYEREGIVFYWAVESVMGQPQDHQMSVHESNGWQRVLAEDDTPGIGAREYGGLVLMARPKAIHDKALRREEQDAREQLDRKREAALGGSLPGVSLDTRHPSALRSNRINRTIERLDVPEN